MAKNVLVIHGPNINLIGSRETGIYGEESIEDINKQIILHAQSLSMNCKVMQSNHEGEIIDMLHAAKTEYDGIVINAGAYTHYSYAIRDAIAAIKIPCVEVHLSNIYNRDEFRQRSVIAPVCAGHIAGFGKFSYMLALYAVKELI
ncbi:type II 3-dehydroquinate dehydratase [Candidatus Soleaferrea massiliensis]|uniref:type II 3-dehydroquinate dehydratase n=1 Tax=Candidatus Soleaferrea massiliensis TaxID=1470354 RepID=UPI00058B4183|nr:type II 3-dehydroquinate dehydratase [Candidatus Soleaferrea massiliensis]